MTDVLVYLQTIAREIHKPESEAMTMAFEAGLRQLWRERTLGRYLRGKITRDEAINTVGIDWVELTERQNKTMLEDLEWALSE